MLNEALVQQVLAMAERTLWVVTSGDDDDTRGGLVATFVNSASLVPALPRLVIGIARHHHTWGLIQRTRAFAAHLVDADHCDLIWRFGLGSGRDMNKFADLACHRGQSGSPLLDDAAAALDCVVEAELDVGDRTLFVGAVVGVERRGHAPALTFKQMWERANGAQQAQMQQERRRDEQLDATALLAWRTERGLRL